MLKWTRIISLLVISVYMLIISTASTVMAGSVVVPNNLKVPPPSNAGALKIAELVNEERAKHGLRPVKFYALSPLQWAVRIRAGEIRDKFEHIRPNASQWYTVLDELRIDFKAAGENIGRASNIKPETVMQLWMSSPEHRDNILNPNYNMIGVGSAWSPSLNVYNWIQIFLETDDANKDFVELLPLYAEDFNNVKLNTGVNNQTLIDKNIAYLKEASQRIAEGDTSVKQYMIQGYANRFLGNDIGARESFYKALKADPSNVNIYVAMARTFDYTYDRQKRLQWLQKGESLGIRNSELYAELAQIYSKMGQDEKALSYANLAVEVNPNSSLAISTRKNILEFQEYKRRNSH